MQLPCAESQSWGSWGAVSNSLFIFIQLKRACHIMHAEAVCGLWAVCKVHTTLCRLHVKPRVMWGGWKEGGRQCQTLIQGLICSNPLMVYHLWKALCPFCPGIKCYHDSPRGPQSKCQLPPRMSKLGLHKLMTARQACKARQGDSATEAVCFPNLTQLI